MKVRITVIRISDDVIIADMITPLDSSIIIRQMATSNAMVIEQYRIVVMEFKEKKAKKIKSE